jgi:hypothetical protein
VCLIRRPEEKVSVHRFGRQQQSEGDVYEEEKRDSGGMGVLIAALAY